jgi:hypothetical protein
MNCKPSIRWSLIGDKQNQNRAFGFLAQNHPEALGKRLDMLAVDVAGPKTFEQALPAGKFAVAMNKATAVLDGRVKWKNDKLIRVL